MIELKYYLAGVSPEDRTSALKRYEEMFDDAGPEKENDIIAGLGSPAKAAIQIKREIEGRVVPSSGDAKNKPEKLKSAENETEATVVSEEDAAEDELPSPPQGESEDVSVNDVSEAEDAEADEEAVAEKAPEENEDKPASVPQEDSEQGTDEEGEPVAGEEPEQAAKEPEQGAEEQPEQDAEDEPEQDVDEESPQPVVSPEAFKIPAEGKKEPVSISVRRVRPFVLVLFIIASVLIGIPLLALVLSVSIAFFAAGAASIGSGIYVFLLGFTVIGLVSDSFLMFGGGFLLSAIGLPIAWFGLWFCVTVLHAVFKGVLRFGRRACYKEDAA